MKLKHLFLGIYVGLFPAFSAVSADSFYVFSDDCVDYALKNNLVVADRDHNDVPQTFYAIENKSVLLNKEFYYSPETKRSGLFHWSAIHQKHIEALSFMKKELQNEKSELSDFVSECKRKGLCNPNHQIFNKQDLQQLYCPTHIYENALRVSSYAWEILYKDCTSKDKKFVGLTYREKYPEICAKGTAIKQNNNGFVEAFEAIESQYGEYQNSYKSFFNATFSKTKLNDLDVIFLVKKIREPFEFSSNTIKSNYEYNTNVLNSIKTLTLFAEVSSYGEIKLQEQKNSIEQFLSAFNDKNSKLTLRGSEYGLTSLSERASGLSSPVQNAPYFSSFVERYVPKSALDSLVNRANEEVTLRITSEERLPGLEQLSQKIKRVEGSAAFMAYKNYEQQKPQVYRDMHREGFYYVLPFVLKAQVGQILSTMTSTQVSQLIAPNAQELFKTTINRKLYANIEHAYKSGSIDEVTYQSSKKYLTEHARTIFELLAKYYKETKEGKLKYYLHSTTVGEEGIDQIERQLNSVNKFCQANYRNWNTVFEIELSSRIVKAFTGSLESLLHSTKFLKSISFKDPMISGQKNQGFVERCKSQGFVFYKYDANRATVAPTILPPLATAGAWIQDQANKINEYKKEYKEVELTSIEVQAALEEIRIKSTKSLALTMSSFFISSSDDGRVKSHLVEDVRAHPLAYLNWLMDHPRPQYADYLAELMKDFTSDEKARETFINVLRAGEAAALLLSFTGVGAITAAALDGVLYVCVITDIGVHIYEEAVVKKSRIEKVQSSGLIQSIDPWSSVYLAQSIALEKKFDIFWTSVQAIAVLWPIPRLISRLRQEIKLLSPTVKETLKMRELALRKMQNFPRIYPGASSEFFIKNLQNPLVVDKDLYIKIFNEIRSGKPIKYFEETYANLYSAPVSKLPNPIKLVVGAIKLPFKAISYIPGVKRHIHLRYFILMQRILGRWIDYYSRIADHMNEFIKKDFGSWNHMSKNDAAQLVNYFNKNGEIFYINERGLVAISKLRDKQGLVDAFFAKFSMLNGKVDDLAEKLNSPLISYHATEIMLRKLDEVMPKLIRKYSLDAGELEKAIKSVVEFVQYRPESFIPFKKLWVKYFDKITRPQTAEEAAEEAGNLLEIALRNRAKERGRSHLLVKNGHTLDDVGSKYEGYFIKTRKRYENYFVKLTKAGKSEIEAQRLTDLYKFTDMNCNFPGSMLRKEINAKFAKQMFWILSGITVPSYLSQRWNRRYEKDFLYNLSFDLSISLYAAYAKPKVFAVEDRGPAGKMLADTFVGTNIAVPESIMTEAIDDKRFADRSMEALDEYISTKTPAEPDASMAFDELEDIYGDGYAMELAKREFVAATGEDLRLEYLLRDHPEMLKELDNHILKLTKAKTMEEAYDVNRQYDDMTRGQITSKNLFKIDPEFSDDLIAIISQALYQDMYREHASKYSPLDNTPFMSMPHTGWDRFWAVRTWDVLRQPFGYWVGIHLYNKMCMWRHTPRTAFAYGFALQSAYRYIEKMANYQYREAATGK